MAPMRGGRAVGAPVRRAQPGHTAAFLVHQCTPAASARREPPAARTCPRSAILRANRMHPPADRRGTAPPRTRSAGGGDADDGGPGGHRRAIAPRRRRHRLVRVLFLPRRGGRGPAARAAAVRGRRRKRRFRGGVKRKISRGTPCLPRPRQAWRTVIIAGEIGGEEKSKPPCRGGLRRYRIHWNILVLRRHAGKRRPGRCP